MVYNVLGYPPEYKELFVKSNLDILTDAEKITIAFNCSKNRLHGEMPPERSAAILSTLRRGASEKVLRIIDFVEKKNAT